MFIRYILCIYYIRALGPLTKWSIQKIGAKRQFFELTIALPRPGPPGPGAKRLFLFFFFGFLQLILHKITFLPSDLTIDHLILHDFSNNLIS